MKARHKRLGIVVVGLAAEIPTGVLADLLPRRMILACGNLLDRVHG